MQLWLALLPKQVCKSLQLAARQQFNLDGLLAACAQLVSLIWIRVAELRFLCAVRRFSLYSLRKHTNQMFTIKTKTREYLFISEGKTGLQLVFHFIIHLSVNCCVNKMSEESCHKLEDPTTRPKAQSFVKCCVFWYMLGWVHLIRVRIIS